MAAEDGSPELGEDDSKSTSQVVASESSPVREPGVDEGESKNKHSEDEDEEGDEEDDEEEEEEEEPRLKYATLTKNLGSLYKNGDATSSCLVAGDKMIVGTHNGNIHVFSMPSLHSLKVYRAHQASVHSISISPYLSSFAIGKLDVSQRLAVIAAEEATGSPQSSPNAKRSPRQPPVPRTQSNDIYVATASIDGNVCIQSLIDPEDVQLRNFGRPVQAVALSPEYKSDRSYLSGGQAGKLILTVGGQKGKSVNATTTGAAATASSWLGSIGLSANTGKDQVLHSDEGIISTIKWSPSGRYIIWANEHGIKTMRSNLHLPSSETDFAWRRISHIDRPEAEEAVGIWKPRIEWIDRNNLESDEDAGTDVPDANGGATKPPQPDSKKDIEEAIAAWGDQIWLLKINPHGTKSGRSEPGPGTLAIAAHLSLGDCIIAGVSLYTQNILIVLAHMEKKVKEKSKKSTDSSRSGRARRQNGLKPELRLINVNTREEIESDVLPMSRFETLAASDYHLAILPPVKGSAQLAQQGYLGAIGSGMTAVGTGLYTGVETVGQGVWDATMYGPRRLGVNRIFSSGDSIRSGTLGQEPPPGNKERNYLTGWIPGFGSSLISKDDKQLSAVVVSQGMKIFIYSPFDTVVAIKRSIADRLQWLVEMKHYKVAWELLNEHPQAAGLASDSPEDSAPPTPTKPSSIARSGSMTNQAPAPALQRNPLAEFFSDSVSVTSSQAPLKNKNSSAEKEKRRIGELWLQQLVADDEWAEAGEVAEKVLSTDTRWYYWVRKFISNNKYDEIAFHVPTFQITPPLPAHIFEIILGHYVSKDRRKFRELIDQWPSDLFEISSITTAITEQIKADNVRKGSEDWCILEECLAKLYLADGHYTEALKCYISLQDADTAMSLMKEHHLIDAVADDIPDFVLLRIPTSQLKNSSRQELQELSSDSIKILVDEATHGTVEVDDVVMQLESAKLKVFLFFYLRALWRGEGTESPNASALSRGRAAAANLAADEGKTLVEAHADTAVELFAEYDRDLLMEFLHVSTSYNYQKALKLCERYGYIEEQVYILSKTGAMKKALFLIIDDLQDVSKAISFTKDQDDPGLWNDFLDYSMSRPKFISGLLAEVGTAIDPIELVKRIPSGLEIEGLKDGLMKMLREYDIQDSISTGAARVLSSEVAVGMGILREGRRQGIKFDVPKGKSKQAATTETSGETTGVATAEQGQETIEPEVTPDHCAACHQPFTLHETQTLIGFACGHVYHVNHLFHEPGDGSEHEHELSLPKLKKNENDEEDEDLGFTSGFTRTVASKVTNARLLKDKVEEIGGCKICRARKDKVADT